MKHSSLVFSSTDSLFQALSCVEEHPSSDLS
uniref:Uncharacterized protein n=1 Tax=Nelumbo nucifera TaxID=4432 RepID=A0A822YKY6_NELNU|nr:TPA_asm: hypothetical protein HUJ06_010427 [Nelumbo nucifera]